MQLSKNPIGNAGAEKIANALKHQNCKLKQLYIDECSLTGKGVSFLLEKIAHSFVFKLVADKNNFDGVKSKAVYDLVRSRCLKYLSLNKC